MLNLTAIGDAPLPHFQTTKMGGGIIGFSSPKFRFLEFGGGWEGVTMRLLPEKISENHFGLSISSRLTNCEPLTLNL